MVEGDFPPPRVSEEGQVFRDIRVPPDHTAASKKSDFDKTEDLRSLFGSLFVNKQIRSYLNHISVNHLDNLITVGTYYNSISINVERK